jgi:phosphate transport system substrate-binding protein
MLKIALVAGMFVGIIGCGGDSTAPGGKSSVAGGRINGGGSSFVYPIMTQWASVYDKEKGVKVNYQPIGSGGGIQQMTAKTIDFGCSDAPMNDDQLKNARGNGGEVVHIPLVMGGAVPVYNLPGIEKPLRFTGPVLAGIFLGTIKKWNDPQLTAINPGVELPDQEIAVIHRSDGSGTTYMWSEYLSKVSKEWAKTVGFGTSLKWPTGSGQKGSDGVAGQVGRSKGSIGYVELIYALHNKIQYGLVQNAEGEFVMADLGSITAAARNGLESIPDDLRYSLTNVKGKDSYPISGTVWAIVYAKLRPREGQLVVDFLRWVTHEGQNYAEGLQYARLPEGLVKRVEEKLAKIKVSDEE